MSLYQELEPLFMAPVLSCSTLCLRSTWGHSVILPTDYRCFLDSTFIQLTDIQGNKLKKMTYWYVKNIQLSIQKGFFYCVRVHFRAVFPHNFFSDIQNYKLKNIIKLIITSVTKIILDKQCVCFMLADFRFDVILFLFILVNT
jgi:hypothetical protein